MSSRERKLVIVLTGEDHGAASSLDNLERKAGGFGSKMGAVGTAAVAGLAAVGVAAVAVGVGLFNVGASFDEAYDQIRVGTGKTGEELAALKDDFRNVVKDVPTDFGSAATAITELIRKTGDDSGPILDQLAEQMLELSRITKTDLTANIDAAAGALVNWNIPITDQSTKMDELFRTSQLTGISFGDLATQLASAGTVMRGVGIDFDTATAIIATLARNGLDVADVMPSLTKAMGEAAAAGKPAAEVFTDLIDQIKAAPDLTTASGIALEVLGKKAGPKFAELVREGKLDYEGLMAAIANGSDTILGAGKDTQDFSEKWTLIKNRVLVGLEPLATKVFDGMGKAMDALGPYVDQFTKWLGVEIPLVVAAVQAKIDEWWPTIVAAFQQIAAWVQENWPQIKATITDVVTTIVEVVSAAVDLIVTIWRNYGDQILAYTQAVWTWVSGTVEGALQIIQGIIDLVMGLIHGDWSRVWQGIKEIFGGIWTDIQAILGGALGAVKAGISAALQFVVGYFTTEWSLIKTIVSTAIDEVIGFVKGMPGRIASAASGMWHGISDAFKAAINTLISMWDNFAFPTFTFHVPHIIGTPIGGDYSIGGWHLPHIPYLHQGGVVPGRPGQDVLAILQAGEHVIPAGGDRLDYGAASGRVSTTSPTVLRIDLNVTVAPGGEREAGRRIVEAIESFVEAGGHSRVLVSNP